MIEKLFQRSICRIDREKIPVEGMAIMDANGRAICEHRWTKDLARNIYSNTKSFTGLAVGMAMAESELSLDSRLVNSFPECLPKRYDSLLESITLRNLLTMSSGFHKGLLLEPARRSGVGAPDYIRYMFSQPVQKEPGAEYFYSTGDSILAARMCEKATGKGLPLFLYERFFAKADVPYPIWEHCPMGHACGGGGLHLRLTDMMKLGILCINEGRWKGEQLVDADWIRQATTKQIDTPQDDPWTVGYGYQFKILPYPGGYRADGAFGQETVILPRQGLVFGIQCPEVQMFGVARDILHEELFENL